MPDYRVEDDPPSVTLTLERKGNGNVVVVATTYYHGTVKSERLITLTAQGVIHVHDLHEDFANRAGFLIEERVQGRSRIVVDRD